MHAADATLILVSVVALTAHLQQKFVDIVVETIHAWPPVGRLIGLFGWLLAWLVACLLGCLVACLVACLVD